MSKANSANRKNLVERKHKLEAELDRVKLALSTLPTVKTYTFTGEYECTIQAFTEEEAEVRLETVLGDVLDTWTVETIY